MRYYIALNVTVFIKRYSTPVNGKKKYKPQDNRLMSLSMFSLVPVLKQTEPNIIHCVIFSSKKHYTNVLLYYFPSELPGMTFKLSCILLTIRTATPSYPGIDKINI